MVNALVSRQDATSNVANEEIKLMKHKLFIDSDTCLEFSELANALMYASRKGMTAFMVLSVYPSGQAKVFNPLLKTTDCVVHFESESEALKHIGSFL